jgi:hypothetical protein
MLAEKELQGHQTTKMKTSFMHCSTPMAPSRTTKPSGARSLMTPLTSRAPSKSLTLSAIAPCTTDPSKAYVSQGATAAKPSSSTVPTGHTSDIKCHRCHGIGHF